MLQTPTETIISRQTIYHLKKALSGKSYDAVFLHKGKLNH